MAIFHFTVKIVSRSRGQSAVAKAAYNAHDRLTNEKTGERHDYRRKGDVMFSGIFAPKDAPDWLKDRQTLWSEVEKAESRKNSQLAREVEIALPHELTDTQRERLVKNFVRENFVRHGMVADVSIHAPGKEGDARNHHAHILLTMREIRPEGFGAKMRELNSKAQLEQWREKWEHLANRHLERHGYEARIDRRSLEAQGIEREATIHIGPIATQFEREGVQTERGDRIRAIEARNRQREQLRAEHRAIGHDLDGANKHKESVGDFRQHQDNAKRERQAERLDKTRTRAQPSAAREAKEAADVADKGISKAGNVAGRLTSGFMKAVDGFLDFFVGESPRIVTSSEYLSNAEKRREYIAYRRAERERGRALDNWGKQLKKSGNDYASLSSSELQYLNKTDLEHIKTNRENGIRALIKARESERERE